MEGSEAVWRVSQGSEAYLRGPLKERNTKNVLFGFFSFHKKLDYI
jgi:hypothetical protein